MGFSLTKITAGDLVGVGVIGLPDTPNLDTASMQGKFEETARDVIIPKLNSVIDELVNNGWTATEILAQINQRISETGNGDMLKSTYDTDNSGVVDDAEMLGGELPTYYASSDRVTALTRRTVRH